MSIKYCWAIVYDEIGGFSIVKKVYEPSDRKWLGKEIFWNEDKAKETVSTMNGK